MYCELSQQNAINSQELVFVGTVRKPMEGAINISAHLKLNTYWLIMNPGYKLPYRVCPTRY